VHTTGIGIETGGLPLAGVKNATQREIFGSRADRHRFIVLALSVPVHFYSVADGKNQMSGRLGLENLKAPYHDGFHHHLPVNLGRKPLTQSK
jgi:hypothetical protein